MSRNVEVLATSLAGAVGAVLAALAVGASVFVAIPATVSVAVVAVLGGTSRKR